MQRQAAEDAEPGLDLAGLLQAKPVLLPSPGVATSKEAKLVLIGDPYVRAALETFSDISLRFFDIEGEPVLKPLNAPVIGISLPPDGLGPGPSSRSVAPGRPTAQRFTDETVVVAGARRGIGAAIAKRFARECAAVLVVEGGSIKS